MPPVFRSRSSRVRDEPGPLRVVVSSRPPSHRVGYVDQLVGDDSAGGAPNGLALEFREDPLSTSALDVVHLTSTAAILGDRRTPAHERIRRAKRFAKAIKRRRIPVVRTLFGDDAARSRTPSRTDLILDEVTTAYIALSSTTPTPGGRRAEVIPHGHLRARYLGYPRAERVPGRMLFVSNDVLPSGYEGPLKVFAVADLPRWTLRIVGRAPSALTGSFARTVSRNPSRISVRDEAISDAARVEEVTRAELVIVASPDSYESLSTIMLALSLDRPVLVESTAATTRLAEEVGTGWVRTHEGPLTAATLEAALHDLEAHPPLARPDLDAREPNAVAARYAAVFRDAAASR